MALVRVWRLAFGWQFDYHGIHDMKMAKDPDAKNISRSHAMSRRERPGRGPSLVYHLALGSNLGDRRKHLEAAVAFLQGCGQVLRRSTLYETSALGMPGAADFYNLVLVLESRLNPLELLAACKEHEMSSGRDLENSHYRDRPIDIDILLAGNLVMDTPELIVPHPRLCERGFMLVPLFEIAPKLVHPLEMVTVTRLLSRLRGGEKIRRLV